MDEKQAWLVLVSMKTENRPDIWATIDLVTKPKALGWVGKIRKNASVPQPPGMPGHSCPCRERSGGEEPHGASSWLDPALKPTFVSADASQTNCGRRHFHSSESVSTGQGIFYGKVWKGHRM